MLYVVINLHVLPVMVRHDGWSHIIVINRPACQNSCNAFTLLAIEIAIVVLRGYEDDDHASVDLDVMPYARKVFFTKRR